MKPTTTPGKARGRVSIEISASRPKKWLRSRNTPAMPAITSVATVTATDSTMVEVSAPKYCGFVTTAV